MYSVWQFIFVLNGFWLAVLLSSQYWTRLDNSNSTFNNGSTNTYTNNNTSTSNNTSTNTSSSTSNNTNMWKIVNIKQNMKKRLGMLFVRIHKNFQQLNGYVCALNRESHYYKFKMPLVLQE